MVHYESWEVRPMDGLCMVSSHVLTGLLHHGCCGFRRVVCNAALK